MTTASNQAEIREIITRYYQLEALNKQTALNTLAELLIDKNQNDLHDETLKPLQNLANNKTLWALVRKEVLDLLASECPEVSTEFSCNYSPAQILAWGEKLKEKRQAPNLARKDLFRLSTTQWAALGNAVINIGVQTLDVSWNDLSSLSSDQWTACFSAITDSGAKALDLSRCRLGITRNAPWIAMGTAIKNSGVHTLDLSGNGLDLIGDYWKWYEFCYSIINSGLKTLRLKFNRLHLLTSREWNTFCDAVEKSGLSTLGLNDEDLLPGTLLEQDFNRFIVALGDSTILDVELDDDFLDKGQPPTSRHISLWATLLCNHIKRGLTQGTLSIARDITIIDNFFLPVDLTEELLQALIQCLEKMNTPIAHYACGFLLSCNLVSFNTDAKPQDKQKYDEKICHDAITFFLKAATNRQLVPAVSTCLWEINTTYNRLNSCDPRNKDKIVSRVIFPSIEQRLSQEELKPYGFESYSQFGLKQPSPVMPFPTAIFFAQPATGNDTRDKTPAIKYLQFGGALMAK